MRTPHLLAALALASAAIAVVPATAAPRPQALAGTTTITATTSGSADVDLLQDAVIQLQPDGSTKDIVLSGGGELSWVSIAMKSNGSDDIYASRVVRNGKAITTTWVEGTRYPQGSTCPDDPTSLPTTVPGVYEPCMPSNPTPKYVVLHQGRYHLRAFTGGKPITLSLRLHGLTGAKTIRPTRTLASTLTHLKRIDTIADRQVRAETTVNVPVASEAILNLDATMADGAVVFGQTGCVYTPGPVAPTDYAPLCPGGTPFGLYGVIVNPYRTPAFIAVTGGDLEAGWQRVGLALMNDQGVTYRDGLLATLERED